MHHHIWMIISFASISIWVLIPNSELYIYINSQLPLSRTRKGPQNVSDLARCPTYPRFRRNCK